ncbi:MAG: NADPH-dependent reductase, partial [Proteobacteria bacterium]|nr:NADPH-dependent reductase [Pseudomonadota bacterium]
MIEVRKGQAPAPLTRAEFSTRFRASFIDPAFDPDYDLSSEWADTKQRIDAAQLRWADPASPSRVLLICGSARNDGTCPGEMSKTFRLLGIARETLEQAGIQADVLDLSLLSSEYGRKIHPCKGCVSTAMPL